MNAPRIDSMRNRIAEVIELLVMTSQELEDLHVLAYDRPSAVEEAKVAGGSAHYYLDTHGDLRARSAYKELWRTLDGVSVTISGGANNALNILREGKSEVRRGPRTTRIAELAEAIAAQQRRAGRGDYTPIRRGLQPDEMKAMDDLRKQRDEAQRKLAEVTKERDAALAQNQQRLSVEQRRRSA